MCSSGRRGGGKKKETHLSNKKKKIHTQTVTVFNIFTIESSKDLTRPDFVFMVIYTHDSSILVHELNLICLVLNSHYLRITLIAQDAQDYRLTQKE